MSVIVNNALQTRVSTARMERAVRRLLREEGLARAEVSVLLTDDAAIREMNRDYRGHDQPTDVLSFAQDEPTTDAPAVPLTGETRLLGDIVISVDTAVRQAAAHNITPARELALLAVHGALHLLGHEDETEAGADCMRAREREILGIELK
jgi:probable rRNA maturation factor